MTKWKKVNFESMNLAIIKYINHAAVGVGAEHISTSATVFFVSARRIPLLYFFFIVLLFGQCCQLFQKLNHFLKNEASM